MHIVALSKQYPETDFRVIQMELQPPDKVALIAQFINFLPTA